MLIRLALCLITAALFNTQATADSKRLAALTDLGNNSWRLVDAGNVTAPPGILAYSSGWLETDRSRLCIFGGGHWNYSGNEVWCFNTAAGGWQEMYAPDAQLDSEGDQGPYMNFDNERYPGALFNPAGEPISEARPMSRHTYDQLEYVPGYGAVLWGGYPWGDGGHGWCEQCKDTWVYDNLASSWRYLYDGTNPSPDFAAGVGASAYSPPDGLIYATAHSQTWTFDPRKARWKRVSTRGDPPYSIEATMEYDAKRHALYILGGSYPDNPDLWRFDIKRRAWEKLAHRGTAPGLRAIWGPGLAYDSANDVLLVYQSGALWVFDPADNTWSQPPYAGPTEESHIFGRLRYDPHNKGAWLHVFHDEQHQTWFYRYRKQ
ncbi:MAG: hypothetical protein OET44_15425 [Gammaproteobacteria bacterium]|nr:hypothetical protein [Gammaproteobacteria bacterium]